MTLILMWLMKGAVVLVNGGVTLKIIVKHLNKLIKNREIQYVVPKKIDSLTNLLENNSKNPAICKKNVFNIFKKTDGMDHLTSSQKNKIKAFYIACIEENGKDGDGNVNLIQGAEKFIGTCPISFSEWNEMECPVLCETSFFEKEDLLACKNSRHRATHPVLNIRQEIIFFEDPIILEIMKDIKSDGVNDAH